MKKMYLEFPIRVDILFYLVLNIEQYLAHYVANQIEINGHMWHGD